MKTIRNITLALAFTFSGCAGGLSPETRAVLYRDYKTVRPIVQKGFLDILTSFAKAYVAKESGFSK